VRYLKLRHGGLTIVDDDLPPELQWVYFVQWCKHFSQQNVYVRGYHAGARVFLHRALTGCPPGLVVDHINRNSFDNRLINIRPSTHSENMKNRDHAVWVKRRLETIRRKNEKSLIRATHEGKNPHSSA
jgi:hypothetical protein